MSQPFWLAETEVTQAQFVKVLAENPSKTPIIKPDGSLMYKNQIPTPVENVTWYEAVRFCKILSKVESEEGVKRFYRLPTEAEWRYACQAGDDSRFGDGQAEDATGDEANIDFKSVGYRSLGIPIKVGLYSPNNFGIFDMHGNVSEWCGDWFLAKYLDSELPENPPGPLSAHQNVFLADQLVPDFPLSKGKVICGSDCTTKYDGRNEWVARRPLKQDERNMIGFRIVCEEGEPSAITQRQYKELQEKDDGTAEEFNATAMDEHFKELVRRRSLLQAKQMPNRSEAWLTTAVDTNKRYASVCKLSQAIARSYSMAKDEVSERKAYGEAALYAEEQIAANRAESKEYTVKKEIGDLVEAASLWHSGGDIQRAREIGEYIDLVEPDGPRSYQMRTILRRK
jgi:hypothetical protein